MLGAQCQSLNFSVMNNGSAPSTSVQYRDTYRVLEPTSVAAVDLVGLDACMVLLDHVLVRPVNYAALYGQGSGTASVQRRFALLGVQSSGKRTAVTRTASRLGLVVVEMGSDDLVPGVMERVGTELEQRADAARAAGTWKGAILVFDHCDKWFNPATAPEQLLTEVNRLVRHLEQRLGDFWICWLSEFPETHPPAGLNGGPLACVAPLSSDDWDALMDTFIRSYRRAIQCSGKFEFSDEQWARLQSAGDHCTPGEIYEFCQRALTWRYRLLTSEDMAAAAESAERRAVLLAPHVEDFDAALVRDDAHGQWSMCQLTLEQRSARYMATPVMPAAPGPVPTPHAMPGMHAPQTVQNGAHGGATGIGMLNRRLYPIRQ